MLRRLLLPLLLCLAPLPADALSCAGVSDVTALGPAGCDFGGLTFDGFAVSPSAGFDSATVGIGAGSQAPNLNFRLALPGPGPGDVLLLYRVSGNGNLLTGVDVQNNAITPPVTIGELVCKPPFALGETCAPANRLAALVVTAGQSAEATFDPQGQIIVFKDISLGPGGFISDFTNSHALTPVPEPATWLLAALAGVGAGWRALRRRGTV